MREYAVAFTFCVALGSMVALAGCGSSSPAPAPSTVAISDALGESIATYVNRHSMQRLHGRDDDDGR